MRTRDMELFLKGVLDTASSRVQHIPSGFQQLWRAQLGHDFIPTENRTFQQFAAFPPSRMKPEIGKGREGRINPKGISYLYLATDQATAMSEVRPWIGAHVSVAMFETTRDLTVIDCSRNHGRSAFALLGAENPTPEQVEEAVWTHIDQAFSKPVADRDDIADYAPTQLLAEMFKHEGYDGLVYKSALTADGFNIALFDVASAKQLTGELREVVNVKFEFQEYPADEYFVRDDGSWVRNVVTDVKPLPARNSKQSNARGSSEEREH